MAETCCRFIRNVCLAYVLLVVALPTAMVPIVHILPYVHERPLLDRLPLALGGTLGVIAIGCFVLQRQGVYSRPAASIGGALTLLGSIAVGTYVTAALSSNLLASLVWATPGVVETKTFKVVEVRAGILRNYSQKLVVQDDSTDETRYVSAARRWFPEAPFREGDVLHVEAKSGPLGTVVGTARRQTAQASPER